MPVLMLLILAISLIASPTEITVEQIKDDYATIFSASMYTVEGGRFVVNELGVNELPTDHLLAELTNRHTRFLEYLIQHGTGITFEQKKILWADSLHFGENFIALLEEDSTFNANFLPVVDTYLAARDIELVGYESVPQKRAVSIEEATNVAIRFFYPDAIQDGTIISHVCLGINGIKDLEGGRDIVLEAFAFSTIFENLEKPEYKLRREWERAKGLMNRLNLSSDEDIRLIRAQGVMWGHMYQSEGLRQALLDGSRRMAEVLPFKITS